MPSRDDLVRYSVLENALRTSLRTLPCSSREDVRRWVHFACQCAAEMPADTDVFPTPGRADCQHGVELAARWARGEDIPAEELQEAWRRASRDAETLTAKMTGARAALWSMLCTIEAAMLAARAEGGEQVFAKLAQAVESAARYARQADPNRLVETAKRQKEILDGILRESQVG
jgi:hypothetical protein